MKHITNFMAFVAVFLMLIALFVRFISINSKAPSESGLNLTLYEKDPSELCRFLAQTPEDFPLAPKRIYLNQYELNFEEGEMAFEISADKTRVTAFIKNEGELIKLYESLWNPDSPIALTPEKLDGKDVLYGLFIDRYEEEGITFYFSCRIKRRS